MVGLVIGLMLAFAGYSMFTTASQKVVVVNPGHSIGYDSGAGGNVKNEAQINQELAGRLVRKLNAMGYKVYITHTTDDSFAGQRLLNQEQGSHLKNVGDATNSVYPDLAISIHHNSGGTSSSGTEIYWSSYRSFDGDGVYIQPNMWSDGSGAARDSSPCPAAVGSQQLAAIVERNYQGFPNLPFRKVVERDDYLPAHATCPCILYEGGFVSNPAEDAYLSSDAYQEEAANRLAAAINEYLGGSGSGFGGLPENNSANVVTDTQPPTINSVGTSATITGDSSFGVTTNVTDDTGVSIVRFATWTENNGQDDLLWQDGVNDGNGNWSATINVAQHNNEMGNYVTHVYAYDGAGNFVGVAAPTVTVSPTNTSKETGLSIEKLNSNMAVAYATRLGAQNYKFAIWSDVNGQDDLMWVDGVPQVDSSARCVINRAEHNNDPGRYIVHCYTQDMRFVGGNEVDFGTITVQSFTAQKNGNSINVNLSGVDSPIGNKGVRFAVWSEINGIDDVIWYPAPGSFNGTYSINANLANHNGSGIYWIHAYLTDNYGLDQLIGQTSIDVGEVTGEGVGAAPNVSIGNRAGNSIPVTITNVDGNYGIRAAVWSEVNGQDDLGWYEASRQGATYNVTINTARHSGNGVYDLHVYTFDSADNMNLIGAYQFVVNEPTASGVSGDTPIMGQSGTTAAQLVNMYNENAGGPFPSYYEQRGVSLGEFCQMYIDEANVENVRADVAFCQAMLETGFLHFGGDVSISQFNFAGLGATGNGVPGENFAAKYGDNANGIRMGIRAQIQHLKAYASNDPLANECVDARFSLVSRGRATTISGLSGTWAVDPTYAGKIINLLQKIK